ncbi:DUF1254 domain-containing protein [Nocardia bhagyanarayanae]|uniref:DUF1254 domain-containing protein n=1 Tax=Nocardia bhagyanarayanae TaxID=1215925 RepID=A0A543EV00_9NOCA|nr:DUF1254 domain-containing protein [Nocardia bhagyanarayanae]TQM25399.1 hypothetical protein FB390_5547 [Nocardia bhagyanarayanae]
MNEWDGAHSSGAGRKITRRTVLGWATTAAVGLAACDRAAEEDPAVRSEADLIANEAYVFGYPLVLMHATRDAALKSTPINRFQHAESLPTPDRRDVVRMNLDTLYSTAWLDLSRGPIVLQVPATDPGRYWLMQIMDAWTNTIHNPSSVRPQVRPGVPTPPFTYVITGPNWSGALPEDLTPLPTPTPTVWILGRIQVNGAADIPAVRDIQRGIRLAPLDDWVARRVAPADPVEPAEPSKPPAEQVDDMDARDFFDQLCVLMDTDPPAPADEPAMARFAEIGIAPGGSVRGLSDADLADAATDAKHTIDVYVDPQTRIINDWTFDPRIGTYGTDYLHRASVARHNLGANLAEDAIYPTYYGTADDNGTPARFRLRFAAGQTPPVDAFWSLTAYGEDDYLVPNPAGIYAVGHQVPVVPGLDGSIELAIQHDDPGSAVPQGNWLPIPSEGPFSLAMRLFAPRPEAIAGRWQPPPVTLLP